MVRIAKTVKVSAGRPHREHRSQKVRKRFGKIKDKAWKSGTGGTSRKTAVDFKKKVWEMKEKDLDTELKIC